MTLSDIKTPFPLFPSLAELRLQDEKRMPEYLADIELSSSQKKDFILTREFLLAYGLRSQETFNAYRSDVERLLLWTWLLSGKESMEGLRRADLEKYIQFYHEPNIEWVTTQRLKHFEGGSTRSNEAWRPFRVPAETLNTRAKKIKRKVAHTSLVKTFSALSVYFDFLAEEDQVEANPIPAVKKRSPYLIKDSQITKAHRLSTIQWEFVLDTLVHSADEDSHWERALFAIVMMKSLYLRISELSDREAWSPSMGDFFIRRDLWWFKVFGKGKKIRDVSVSDSLLPFIKRYRAYRGLDDMPTEGEQTPLIPKERGIGNIGQRQLTRLIDEAFEMVGEKMKAAGMIDDAKSFSLATTHWLRHTGASMDIDGRPLKHIADDLGHASLQTTDRIYVQSDEVERGLSGKKRKI